MAFTLRESAKITVDFEGNQGSTFTLTVTQKVAGSLRLVSATYNGQTQNGPNVSFTMAAGLNPLVIVLAFATEGETGFLTEVDSAGATRELKKLTTRTSTDRTFFLEGV